MNSNSALKVYAKPELVEMGNAINSTLGIGFWGPRDFLFFRRRRLPF